MCCTRVLALLTKIVGLAESFSWDIVESGLTQLQFYDNGTLTHKEDIPSAHYIASITHDPVHDRVLFADFNVKTSNMSIFSFDISTRKIKRLVTSEIGSQRTRVVYDPVTESIFWNNKYEIYSFSLNPASCSKSADGNLLVSLHHLNTDIAVDSCGGYIYWITEHEMERVRLDGSGREILIIKTVWLRISLVIDQQTQRIFWTEKIRSNGTLHLSIESANFDGKNRTTLYTSNIQNESTPNSLAISKDYIYWKNLDHKGTWQLPKNPSESQHMARKLHTISSSSCWPCQRLAAKYTIKEQIQEIKSCEALQYLIPYDSKPESTVTICQHYCLQGNCSVNVEGQPKCSCKPGYSGERCEVNACHEYHCLNGGVCSLNEEDEPYCQCAEDYKGEKCEILACKDNCASTEREPEASCDAGKSGESEVNACHQYCLNNGVCSLDEKSEPVCQCPADYEGERCDVPAFLIKCFLYAYKDVLPPVTLSKAVKSTCTSPSPVL